MARRSALFLFLFLMPAPALRCAQSADWGSDLALKGLDRAWVSLQAVAFKSDLGGDRLRPMEEAERRELQEQLQRLWQDLGRPRLTALGLSLEGGRAMVEDAWTYIEEAQQSEGAPITRELLVSMARRNNVEAPNGRDPHLRLFFEIQQDGLRHVGRVELALIEPVRPLRGAGPEFYAVTWMKSVEAVPLGVAIDREALRGAVEGLLEHFEAAMGAAR